MYDKLWEDIYKATGVKKPKTSPEQERQWDDMLEGIMIRCLADAIRNEIPKATVVGHQEFTEEEDKQSEKEFDEYLRKIGVIEENEIVTEDGEIVPRGEEPSARE